MTDAITDSELRAKIDEIEQVSADWWLQSLNDRKRAELEFHDRHRDREANTQLAQDTYEQFYGNLKYYKATNSSREYIDEWIAREAKGRVFLDYACGAGVNAINAAKAGARLSIGLDISPVSVANATADARDAGVAGNTRFFQGDAENTMLPDASIDRAICSGMLHHLDLSYALPELRRIVAPGGRVLVHEALDYNPLIKLYRQRTPAMRTEWEKAHILSLKDVRFARRFFAVEDIRYWHVLAIAAPHAGPFAPLLTKADTVLERLPGIRRLAWMFTFEMVRVPD